MFLSLSTIFTYLSASPTSRCIVEGEGILAASHLVCCGVNSKTDRKWSIKAYCLQTSAVKSDPHEINGCFLIIPVGRIEIETFTCTCKAGGSGACKHVTATLLFCSRIPLEELEELSSTDTECVWKIPKTRVVNKYLPQPLNKTHCFGIKKRRKQDNFIFSKEEINKVFQLATSELPHSSFTLHRQGRRRNTEKNKITEIPQYVKDIFCHSQESLFIRSLELNFSLLDCCRMVLDRFKKENVLDAMCCVQGTLEWKRIRKHKITGSTCYSIFTFKKQDWTKMLTNFFSPKSLTTKEMRHGSEQEPFALEAFKKMNPNLEIKQIGIFICQTYPWLAYSPDGVIFREGKPSGLLEIKCPYLGKIKSGMEILPTLKYLNKDYTLKVKHSYYAQIQLGMALLNLSSCEFIVYFSKEKNYLQISIPFNENFAKELIETVSKKYFDHMIHHTCA